MMCMLIQLSVGSQTSNPNSIGLGRFRRQVGDLQNPNGEERTYDLEISFPTTDADEVENSEGRRQKITELFEKLLFENEQLDVSDTLLNVAIDPESISIGNAFTCDEGDVVRDNECGKISSCCLFKSKNDLNPCILIFGAKYYQIDN